MLLQLHRTITSSLTRYLYHRHKHLRTVPTISRQISLPFSSLRSMKNSRGQDSNSSPKPSIHNSSISYDPAVKTDESLLPTQFGKKRKHSNGKRLQLGQSNSKHVAGTNFADCSEVLPEVKPFDMCLSGSRSSATSTGCLNEKWNEMGHIVEGTEQRILRPGMVLLKRYITLSEQVEIVKKCRVLGLGQGGFYQPGYQDGAKLRLQMMCLGLNWDPETRKYKEQRVFDGSKAPAIPHEFSLLVKRAIQDAHALIKKEYKVSNVEDILPSMSPNICIVNFYTTHGRLGHHQDRDESRESLLKGLPVVSLSVGDSAEFLYGDQRNVDKAEKVLLESGDVLIFGGKSRHIFHSVASIIPKSAPRALYEETSLRPGRVNLTFRQF
ncbi:uncharacterized protein LOC115952417 [Quercus lobata]|nr:uncharacterized protein LOC115952417 [Quercus lobata]